jgi:uncharacterized SAM-binding protein YcdF (DUF218 family)
MWWKRAIKRRWLVCLVLMLVIYYAGSARIVTRLWVGSLEWSYPYQESTPDHGDVIVMLGAGCRYYGDDPHPLFVMDESALRRALHVARVYKKLGGCPVIVSGYYRQNRSDYGPQYPDDPILSNPMAKFLLEQGVDRDDIIIEDQSRTTHENAVYTKKLIEEKGFKDIVLVTDASHMNRSVLCFEKLGMEVTPAACNYYAEALEFSPQTLLPSYIGVRQARDATREYIGLVWYWIQGRI